MDTGIEKDKYLDCLQALIKEIHRLQGQVEQYRLRAEMREKQISEAHEEIFAVVPSQTTGAPCSQYRYS